MVSVNMALAWVAFSLVSLTPGVLCHTLTRYYQEVFPLGIRNGCGLNTNNTLANVLELFLAT